MPGFKDPTKAACAIHALPGLNPLATNCSKENMQTAGAFNMTSK